MSGISALACAVALTGCWGAKPAARTFTPPPPQPAPVIAQADHLPDPPLIASTPDLSDVALVPNSVAEAPAPPAPRPPRRTPAPSAPPKAVASGASEQTPPPAPAPRLGQILSADQTREFSRELDEKLDRVRRVISALQRKNLTPEQADVFNRIQVFQKQAEQAREQDLVLAVSIARRADLLAKDLQERVP